MVAGLGVPIFRVFTVIRTCGMFKVVYFKRFRCTLVCLAET